MRTNRVTYYNRYFAYKDTRPEYIYAIWQADYASMFHVASFKTREQLDAFAKKLDFTYTLEERNSYDGDKYMEGCTSKVIEGHTYDKEIAGIRETLFSNAYGQVFKGGNVDREAQKIYEEYFQSINGAYGITDEHLKIAKPIKALSNGSIVDCLYISQKDRVLFYRPNPNCKEFYKPLPTEEHIKYVKENGTF